MNYLWVIRSCSHSVDFIYSFPYKCLYGLIIFAIKSGCNVRMSRRLGWRLADSFANCQLLDPNVILQ